MISESLNDCRRAFDKWCEEERYWGGAATAAMWEAWQAASHNRHHQAEQPHVQTLNANAERVQKEAEIEHVQSEMRYNDDNFSEEKLRDILRAHLDGVYLMSRRAMCDRLVSVIANRYLALPMPVSVNLEDGAKAAARWRNGRHRDHYDYDALSPAEKNAYCDQVKGIVEAWGLKWE